MKKLSMFFLIFIFTVTASEASVNFHLNTSTAPGFTDSTETLVIRGSMNGWSGNEWELTNEGGDYWTLVNDTLSDGEYEYKYVVIDNMGTESWESTDNRILTVSGDTDLPQDYWENGSTAPYTETDSIDVWFRVSTAGIIGYDGDTMFVAGYMNSWNGEPLLQEGDSEFWSRQYSFDPNGLTVGYKFQHGLGGWESLNNRTITVSNDTTIAWSYFDNQPPTDSEVVYTNVTLTLVDEGLAFQDIQFKGQFSNWNFVEGDDDGTNGDENANDGIWTAILDSVIGPNSYEWGAVECDSTCYDGIGDDNAGGTWLLSLIGEPNQEFAIDDNGSVTGSTSFTIPYLGDEITKAVIFSVDMTEWLDEENATGMPIFSVARGDQMQVRGAFNGWNCDNPADCEMTRTPGTNIFSLATSITGYPTTETEFKYFMELDSASIEILNQTYGDIYNGMGWEDSPKFGGGNRYFTLGADDETGLLELPLSGYYDLPIGGVVPCCRPVTITFNVDMADAIEQGFDASEDSVYLSIKDRWLKYTQGLGDDYKVIATTNGDGTYSANSTFVGPFPWHMTYTWGFYDVSEFSYIEEGGGFGFGRFRARYHHANENNDCWWRDYSFPQDTFQVEDPPLPVEEYDPESICIPLADIGDELIPNNYFLSDNYPNPFNPTTSFTFGLSSSVEVKISIYNILGQKIFSFKKGKLDAGSYEFNWNGENQIGEQVTSGIYFYEMEAGNEYRDIKKMTLLK
jgi:hypothetical protein